MDNWNPLTDTVPIHSWIHPWLPMLQSRLEPLYPPIRSKLANALQRWHPSDASARLILQPWKNVFTVGAWEAFMVKNIIPKLGMSLLLDNRSSNVLANTFFIFYDFLSKLFPIYLHVITSISGSSFVSGRAGDQPSPAADGAISLGDGLGRHVVPLQPCVPAGQKLFYKMVAGQWMYLHRKRYKYCTKKARFLTVFNLVNKLFVSVYICFLLILGSVFMAEQQS